MVWGGSPWGTLPWGSLPIPVVADTGFVDLTVEFTGTSSFVAALSTSLEPAGEAGMSLRKLRARIASIIEGTAVVTRERGMAPRFKHDPASGSGDKPADSRRFFIAASDIASRGPFTPRGASNRRLDTINVVVVYQPDLEDGLLEEIVSSDYDAISARLLDTALWETTTSTIISLTEDDERMIPATITRDDNAVTLTMTLTVEHQR